MDHRLTRALQVALIVLVMLAARAASAATPPECVRVAADRFKGRTTVELKPLYVYKDAGFMAINVYHMISMFFSSEGSFPSAPDSITLVVLHAAGVRRGVSNSDADWAFAREGDHDLVVILDDVRRDLGPMRYLRGSEANAFLLANNHSYADKWLAPEVLAITLEATQLTALINAQACEGRVDGLPFFLQNKRQGSLDKYRAFASYVAALRAEAPQPASPDTSTSSH